MAADPMTSAYKVLSTLKHNNKVYRKGAQVRLSDKDAAPLLKIKTVEPAK
jgi:hypothetical protein